jgi:Icc-related predicted phosphoesterase
MKLYVTSDIHLEFGDLNIVNEDNVDVLILGGDICVANDMTQHDPYRTLGPDYKSNRYHEFFQRCSAQFPHVIFIAGNHEHYHGDFADTIPHLKTVLAYLPNLHVLDKEILNIDDFTFIGGTLWSDMNQEDADTMRYIRGAMNDFKCVKNSNYMCEYKQLEYARDEHGNPDYSKDPVGYNKLKRPSTFSPADAVEDHKKMLGYIKAIVSGKYNEKFVIVGHHSPSRLSTHPRYQHDILMNGGFSSSLDEFILDHPQIKLWTHGHTHEDFDYMIGSTRIVCNPRGYINYESRAGTWKPKLVEI